MLVSSTVNQTRSEQKKGTHVEDHIFTSETQAKEFIARIKTNLMYKGKLKLKMFARTVKADNRDIYVYVVVIRKNDNKPK